MRVKVHLRRDASVAMSSSNTFGASSLEQVARIVHNATRREGGVREIHIHVVEPHDEPGVAVQLEPVEI